MPAAARVATPQAAAPAPQSSVASARGRPSAAAPTGPPLVRLASPSGGVARAGRRVVPIHDAPTLQAGPGQPALAVAGPGEPLRGDIRQRLESGFGADLGAVRVHRGAAAARLALGHGSRAFAFGHHVVLGETASPGDLALMAHEVAHVLQQQGVPAVQRCTGGVCTCGGACGRGGAQEAEAARAAATVSAGGTYAVTGQAPTGEVQRAGEDEGLLVRAIWGVLDEFAPTLVPIIRRGAEGVFDWIKGKVSGALKTFVDTVMAPVRSVAETGKWLQGHFGPLLVSMQDAAAKIAQNDCKPLTDAAAKIEDVASKLITPVIEKLQLVVGKVGDFFKGVWDKLGAPAWEFIKKYAGAQWEALQQLGEWIWDKTAAVRRLGERAWTWLKNKIGIGEGPEGQNGILQWIQGKASAAWDWVQAKIEPYKKQITAVLAVVAGMAVMLSPAGPIILAGAAIYGVVQGVKWIRANLAGGNAIVRARAHAQTVLIPQLIGAINRMTAAVTRMATAVSGKLGEFAAGLGKVVGAAASTALEFLVDAAQWLANKATELAVWASEKLTALADWIQKGFARLLAFLQPVLDFLGKVGRLLVDIYGLPPLLLGALWKRIPACIRDPFVDWIIPLILRQIDIFKELVKDNEAWAKTKADVMNIVRLVFVNKDLKGAIKATFHLILRVFNVPYELLVQVVQKAQAAWDTVTAAPIKFIKNTVRTLGRGLKIYWDHLKENLLFGIEGWLFGELAEKGIARPKSWTDPWDLMQFSLDVMGLSMSHIFELMEKRFEKTTVDRLRGAWRMISRAWDWIMDMRGKKPAEVTKEIVNAAKEFGKSILEGIVAWIIEQVGIELATMATAAAASAGLSEVLDAVRRIYRAIKTAVRWARSIVDMVNRTLDAVLDIAAGNLEGPAEILHGAMKKATPAVIGFLGDQVGLGGIADEIRSLIDKLRKKVDDAVLAVIDALRSLFGAIVQGVKGAATKVLGWLGLRKDFEVNKHPHSLTFDQKGATPTLQLSSTPIHMSSWLNTRRAELQSASQFDRAKEEAADGIEKDMRTIGKLTYSPKETTGDPAAAEAGAEKMVKSLLDRIATNVAVIGLSGDTVPVPRMVVSPGFSSAKASNMTVQFLFNDSNNHRAGAGTSGRESLLGAWEKLSELGISRSYWKSGHMLNANFGGLPVNSNLIPIPQSVNRAQEASFDKPLGRNLYDKKKPIWLRFTVVRGHSQDAERHFISLFRAEAAEMPQRDGAYQVPTSGTITFEKSGGDLPYPALRTAPVSLNGLIRSGELSRDAVAAVAGATQLPAQLVADLVSRGVPLGSVEDIASFIKSRTHEYGELRATRYLAHFERVRGSIVL